MKICIIRNDRMGDMILTFPIIKSIKEENVNSIVHIVGSKKNVNISKHFFFIDKFIQSSKSLSTFISLSKYTRSQKYDYCLNFSPGWFGIFLCFFSKSKFKSSLILQSRYKSKYLSKFWQILFTKIFFSKIKIVNRFKLLRQNKNIHQTKMMMSLTSTNGIKIRENTELGFNFLNSFKLIKNEPICIIHLSSKWINNYYSEENFIQLLNTLKQKDIAIYLTSDETTVSKFSNIFNNYPLVKKTDHLLKIDEQIIICDNFDFENWVSLINQADYVITPECGCAHIASLTKCKLSVIYDSNNHPSSIINEYAPWKKKYLALETNDSELNIKLLNFI